MDRPPNTPRDNQPLPDPGFEGVKSLEEWKKSRLTEKAEQVDNVSEEGRKLTEHQMMRKVETNM